MRVARGARVPSPAYASDPREAAEFGSFAEMVSGVVGVVDRERGFALPVPEGGGFALDIGGRRVGVSAVATQQGGAGGRGGDADVRDSAGDCVPQQECEAPVRAPAPHSVACHKRSRDSDDVFHVSGAPAAGRFSAHAHFSSCAPSIVDVGPHLDCSVPSCGASPEELASESVGTMLS